MPAQLRIDEGDLCTLLLNMLDNALEAAGAAPLENRQVRCKIHLTQGFLAIRCENTYAGAPRQDEIGKLQTSKPNRESHGFGLPQMRAVAEKYHSILNISYGDGWFTLQTALRLPKQPQ